MKKNKATEVTVRFQITNVQLLDFNLIPPIGVFSPKSVFQLDINLGEQLDAENSTITVVCRVSVFDETKEMNYARMSAACFFSVSNFSDFFDKKQKLYVFPEDFLTSLKSITFSTTRGLFAGTFRGTFLQHIVLPLIDPTKLSSVVSSNKKGF